VKNVKTLFLFFSFLFVFACSFDYETSSQAGEKGVVLTMKEVEYVRVREGSPSVRIRAEEASRFEARHAMELKNFTFEQFSADSGVQGAVTTNVQGRAGTAQIELDTGNLSMGGGVYIESASEDMYIDTSDISWKDKERMLSAPGVVHITRRNGTELSGKGLSADMRRRSWEFQSEAAGRITEDTVKTENAVNIGEEPE
jgi:LPS export ABC transporter protein LptC